MRSKDETLREALLLAAREISDTKGPEAVNIREIAKMTGIASGTLYNYFSGKNDILLALTERYWCETLEKMENEICSGSFLLQLEEIYEYLKEQIRQSAGKMMGSLGEARADGRKRMQTMQNEMNALVVKYIDQDEKIRKGLWSSTFTKEAFAAFVTMNLMTLLEMKEERAEFLIEIVRRTLY